MLSKELCSRGPWEGGSGSWAGEALGGTFLLCADPAAGNNLVLHLRLGWAQPFIHTEDPLELPHEVGEVYSVFSALSCPIGLLPSHKALFICQPRGGRTSVLDEMMLC